MNTCIHTCVHMHTHTYIYIYLYICRERNRERERERETETETTNLHWGNDDKFALGKMSDLNARDGAGDMVGRGKWCMGKEIVHLCKQ